MNTRINFICNLVAFIISNTNNDIDKNKIVQAINDMIEPTKAKGGNVIELLKKIADTISKDPAGVTANKIINKAKTK